MQPCRPGFDGAAAEPGGNGGEVRRDSYRRLLEAVSMDYSISYELRPEDYIDAQVTHDRHSDAVKKNILKSRLNLASFYVFLILILYHMFAGIARFIVLGLLAALGTAHIAMVRKIFELRVRRLSKKLIDGAGGDPGQNRKRLRIKDDEIEYFEKKRTKKFAFAEIQAILESERNYFIYWDESDAVILPKIIDGDGEMARSIIERIKGEESWSSTIRN